MNTYSDILTIITILFILCIYYYYKKYNELIKIQIICWIIVSRGIIASNPFWWKVSELFLEDSSAITLYKTIKDEHNNIDIYGINIFGTPVNLVLDNSIINTILDNSPFVFGSGKLKQDFFNQFMSMNLGISEGVEWIKRRELNEKVLDTGCLHQYAKIYDTYISEIFNNINKNNTMTNIDFNNIGRKVTSKIVFGLDQIPDQVYTIFSQANSAYRIILDKGSLNTYEFKIYLNFLKKSMIDPEPYSLIWIAKHSQQLQSRELLDQIPHWIFPIVGQYISSFPRLLLLLQLSTGVRSKLERGFREVDSVYDIYKFKYLRWVLLELFRLFNPVVTTFRTLLTDYCFNEKKCFTKGDNFLILNAPILRNPEFWNNPDSFNPDRWIDRPGLEDSYHYLSFIQGPQKCPGKDLILFILGSSLYHMWKRFGTLKAKDFAPENLDINNLPQMINPYSIILTF